MSAEHSSGQGASPESGVKSTADAVRGVVEAVPIYQDLLQPAAKEVGKAVLTVAKTIHIVLAPISAMVWGYDQIKDFVSIRVAEKLKDVSPERLTAPPANVAGPALEALKYTGYQAELRELYANLLATSIDSKTIHEAHPAFVQVIQQLSPDEAKMLRCLDESTAAAKINIRKEAKDSSRGTWHLRHFSLLPLVAGCVAPGLGSNYLVNLARLGLVDLLDHYELTPDGEAPYEPIISRPEVQKIAAEIAKDTNSKITIEKGAVALTPFGFQFCAACVKEGTHKP